MQNQMSSKKGDNVRRQVEYFRCVVIVKGSCLLSFARYVFVLNERNLNNAFNFCKWYTSMFKLSLVQLYTTQEQGRLQQIRNLPWVSELLRRYYKIINQPRRISIVETFTFFIVTLLNFCYFALKVLQLQPLYLEKYNYISSCF